VYLLGRSWGGALVNAIIIRQAAVASGSPSAGAAVLWQGLRNVPANILMVIVIAVVVGICLHSIGGRSGRLSNVEHCGPLRAGCLPWSFCFLCSWPALLVGTSRPDRKLRYSALI